MTGAGALDEAPRRAWIAFWRWRQMYHRYSVDGLGHLEGGRAVLIAGYHGRPFAYDMCMLTVAIHDRLGYLPHGVIHRGIDMIPPARWVARALGFVTEDGAALAEAIARGEHVMVTPGGADEGCRGPCDRYRVRWGRRTGYLRLAIRHGLSVVPVGAAGADDAYVGLYDGPALGRRFGLPADWSWLAWLGLGPLGPWPLSPPFPVRMRQLVGAPIDPRAEGVTDPADRDGVLRLHDRVARAVQALLDRARSLP